MIHHCLNSSYQWNFFNVPWEIEYELYKSNENREIRIYFMKNVEIFYSSLL